MSATAEERRAALVELFEEVKACRRCPLHETRTNVVFGAGNADAELMFVGEAPGAEEDRQGLPFVGRAGQLLNQMLAGIGLERGDVFIANVLKSRPPGNRDPQPGEIEACRPYLFEQIRLIEPRVVCTLGNFSTKLLTGNPTGITRVRGTPQVHELGGRTVFLLPLFHPAAALRTPAVKQTLEADFATLPPLLEQPLPRAAEDEEEIEEGPVPGPPQPPDEQMDFFGVSVETSSPQETEALGGQIAARLRPGSVVVVSGDLGAGKTTLVRGACRALGVEEPVTSPTFTIGQRYRGNGVGVSHLDLYRLEGMEGEEPTLLDDYLDEGTIAFVEWPAAAAGRLGRPAFEVRISHGGGDRRLIEVSGATGGREACS